MRSDYIREENMTDRKFIKKARKIVRDYLNLTVNCGVNKQNIEIDSLSMSLGNYKAVFTCEVMENQNKYEVIYNSDTDVFYLSVYDYRQTIEYQGDDITVGRDFSFTEDVYDSKLQKDLEGLMK